MSLRTPTHRPALLHKLGLATVQEICLTACARPGNFWPLVAKQRRLASDAKPNAVLIEPGVREPASPRKWLSVLDSFFLEYSGHHRGISIECYRDFLVGNLIGGWSGCFDRLQELGLVGKRAVEFGVDESCGQHLIQRADILFFLGKIPGAFQRANFRFIVRDLSVALRVRCGAKHQ